MIWDCIESLPDRKLQLIYHYAKSAGIGQPHAFRLVPYIYEMSSPVPFTDQHYSHDLTTLRIKIRRPSLLTFFQDPRDMIRLREIVRRRGLL